MKVEELKWIGKSKISKLKGATKTYATVRLGDDESIINKTAQIYRAKINGFDGFLVLLNDEMVQLSPTEVEKSLNYVELEERLNKLENMFYQLYDVVMKKETNFSGDINDEHSAGGGIRTHAGRAQWLSRPSPYHSATPA